MKIAAYGRLSTGSAWREAGWFVNITPTGSQFVVIANQFAIADPNNDGSFTYPFVVQNGEVYIQNARLGTLKFDILQANNGKMVLRGYDNFADIRILF
ncbi:phage tail tip fiber protein [Brucella intermedia]|uniref:phage tail tip fiber protein n=1 Tax=Brucella intermedia TaxID=94625 RepID=UPI003AB3E897